MTENQGSRKDRVRQLVIDTATEALSVALFTDGELMDFHHEIAGRGHAEKLIPIIAKMDDGGRADTIIVDSGPGSFTGVRVGLAAAKALAYGWNISLRGYDSLTLLAAMARTSPYRADTDPASGLAVAITGGHGELFWRLFDPDTLAPQTELRSTTIALLAEELKNPVVYGSGAAALIDARGFGRAVPLYPDARHLPLMPEDALRDDMAPIYGRGADAVPLAARKG